MSTSRRSWLKQVSFGLAGLGLANVPALTAVAMTGRLTEPPEAGVPVY